MTSNERTQLILSLALGAAIFTAMNYDTSQVWLVILAGYLFVVVVSYVRRVLAVRRMVRALRRLDPAFRRRVVNAINSEPVREYYDQRLRLEGDADVAGVVERYPFAPSDRSEQTRWYWTLMLVAGLALASPILWPHMAVWQRAIAPRPRRPRARLGASSAATGGPAPAPTGLYFNHEPNAVPGRW